MPAGEVTVRLNLNKDGYSAGMTAARKQAQQLSGSFKELQGHTVSSMQAASASIRVLEGGITGNIRAAERFISLLPGVGKALQGIFPVVGGLAFAGVFVKIGEEAYRAIHQVEQLRNASREGFLSISESAMKSADSMRVANDKLEEQIALLEHKTPNTMQTALDEARVAADDLASSLNKDYTEFKKLLDASHGGILGGILGKGISPEASGGLQDRFANIHTLGLEAQRDTRSGNTAGAADVNAKLRAAQEELLKWTTDQVAMRQGRQQYQPDGTIAYGKSFSGPSTTYAAAHPGEDQGITTDAMQSAQDLVLSQMDAVEQRKRDISDQAQQKKDEAANKASAAAQKAQALLLKQDEDAEKKQNAFNKMSINEVIQFWEDRKTAFTNGGQQYLEVQNKIYDEISKRPDLFTENKKNQAEAGKFTVEGNDMLGNAQKALITGPAVEQMERATRSNETYNAMVARGAEAQAKATAAYREASIAIGLQEGTLSKLAAAQALAKVHEDEHAAAIAAVNKELRDQLALVNGDTNLKGDDLARAKRNANQTAAGQTDQINGAYAVTRQQDAASIYANTSSGQAADTYRTMLQSWSDMTGNIAAAMTKAADSFNGDIAAAITGHGKKGDFGKTFSTLGESLVKSSLQKGESALFGGGQLGASPNNPIWTRNAGSAGAGTPGAPNLGPFIQPTFGPQGRGGGGGILSGVLGKLFGGGGSGGGGEGGDSLSTMSGMLGGPGGAGGLPQLLLRGGVMDGFSMPGSAGLLTMPGLGLDTTGAGLSSVLGLGGSAGGAVGSAAAGVAGDAASMFAGFFAEGGDVLANRPAIVGERGPEMFVPHTAGRIVPNHQLGGGGDTHHWHIDARGATDPAAIHAAVMRAAPHIIAASVQAQHHSTKRSPSGR